MRKCKICNKEKSLQENFGKTGKNTYRHQCNDCMAERRKSTYLNGGKEYIYNRIYGSYKKYFRAQLNRRGRKKTLSVDECLEILKKQNYKCSLTNLDFELEANSPYLPTLDRIKNGGEYNKDNVRIVCNAANSFRNKWNDSVFFEICRRVSENYTYIQE